MIFRQFGLDCLICLSFFQTRLYSFKLLFDYFVFFELCFFLFFILDNFFIDFALGIFIVIHSVDLIQVVFINADALQLSLLIVQIFQLLQFLFGLYLLSQHISFRFWRNIRLFRIMLTIKLSNFHFIFFDWIWSTLLLQIRLNVDMLRRLRDAVILLIQKRRSLLFQLKNFLFEMIDKCLSTFEQLLFHQLSLYLNNCSLQFNLGQRINKNRAHSWVRSIILIFSQILIRHHMFGFKKEDGFSWTLLAIVLMILYFVFSDGKFSIIFTLAGTVQTFGFVLIAMKIRRSRTVIGLSRQTFLCYTVIFGIRAILFMIYKGYLPNDTTGDVIFRIQQFIATFLSAYILYCIMVPYSISYNQDLDTVKSYYLIGVAFILAILFHSNLNKSLLGDFLWAFTQYLQTFAILSQFVLFRNKQSDIETYTSHFVAAQAISRVLFIIFWVFTYAQLNTDKASSLLSEYVGYWFMISQVIHLFIMADFMYYWIKAMRSGSGTIQLPVYI